MDVMAVAMKAGLINKRDGPPCSSTSKTALHKYPLFTHQLHPPGFCFFSELQTGVQQYPSSTTHTHAKTHPAFLYDLSAKKRNQNSPTRKTQNQNSPTEPPTNPVSISSFPQPAHSITFTLYYY
jgi:hypothetical protein